MLRLVQTTSLALVLAGFLGTPRTADAASACVGDCDNDNVVGIHDVVLCVDIALGTVPAEECPLADPTGDGIVRIDEILQSVFHAIEGCPAPPASPTPSPTDTFAVPTSTPTLTATSTPTRTATAQPTTATPSIPTSGPEMLAWLQAGSYLSFTPESALHASALPHSQLVLTYFNQPLLDSLAAGQSSHPAGSAAVKELYDDNLFLQGWTAMVKVQDNSDDGMGWYWYEGFGDSIDFSGVGLEICTGCHGDTFRGLTSKDFVLSPFPLQ